MSKPPHRGQANDNLPFMFWSAGYFRPDRPPELVLLMSDMAWLEVVMYFSPFSVQCVAIAFAGFMDRSEHRVFPRWCCYVMLWTAILYLPASMAIFFFSGPFAFNGLIAFWVPVVVFSNYILVLAYVMNNYVKVQEAIKRQNR